jgi:hypothetical protein
VSVFGFALTKMVIYCVWLQMQAYSPAGYAPNPVTLCPVSGECGVMMWAPMAWAAASRWFTICGLHGFSLFDCLCSQPGAFLEYFWTSIWDRRKHRMDHNKDSMRIRAQSIRTLQKQPTRILLSTCIINIEIEQYPGENGYKPQTRSLLWHTLLGLLPALGAVLFAIFLSQ